MLLMRCETKITIPKGFTRSPDRNPPRSPSGPGTSMAEWRRRQLGTLDAVRIITSERRKTTFAVLLLLLSAESTLVQAQVHGSSAHQGQPGATRKEPSGDSAQLAGEAGRALSEGDYASAIA